MRRKTQRKPRRLKGGRFGKMKFIYSKPTNESRIAGAGGYGVVLEIDNYVVKLLKNINDCPALINEANIQLAARNAVLNANIDIFIPNIFTYETEPIVWRREQYICGIIMEKIPAYDNDGQLHIILGDSDEMILNRVVGVKISDAVASTNLPRGFYASPELLEEIWEESKSSWTIEKVAYIMGQTYRALINVDIIPNDLEFIYGADDKIWCIDFGLCRFGKVDPQEFLHKKGVEGMASEIYIPQEGFRGRTAFLKGFSSPSGKN
jgi:hypothetical protein